jgi:hypothetical protein
MWRYGLLGAPIFGLALFYTLPFEPALLVYLPGVGLAFWLYDRLAERSCSAGISALASLAQTANRRAGGAGYSTAAKRVTVAQAKKGQGK